MLCSLCNTAKHSRQLLSAWMKAADHHHDHSKHFGFKPSIWKKTWTLPAVQFLSCSPMLLKYTAVLACCVFCRQHLHHYTTPNMPHGQATHVSSVSSLSYLRKFGTVSKHLPLKKSFKDIHSKDLFMLGKARSTKCTMLTQADREVGTEPQDQCTPLHKTGSLQSAQAPAKIGFALC